MCVCNLATCIWIHVCIFVCLLLICTRFNCHDLEFHFAYCSTCAENVYNIPLVIWLQKSFPQTTPLVYVTPTPKMCINPSRFVDTNGEVCLPYLSDWNDGHCDLATLVQVLCGVFAENVPVYTRRSQSWGPQPSQPLSSYQSPSK